MSFKRGRYGVVVWHSEFGSVWYVTDYSLPTGEQPQALASFRSRIQAEEYVKILPQ